MDPSAPGKRLVVAPQKLDPHMLEDVRKAEAVGPRVRLGPARCLPTRTAHAPPLCTAPVHCLGSAAPFQTQGLNRAASALAACSQGALLIGLGADDCAAVQAWFDAMEPGLVASCCPPALLAGGTLSQAVGEGAALPRRPWEQQPADAPPVVFFSGMSGEEQVALIQAWAEHTGLQAPAFAAGEFHGAGCTARTRGTRVGRGQRLVLLSSSCRSCAPLPPPAVTAGTLAKPLSKLVADIVRAQAQAPPPGFNPEQVREEAASRAAAGDTATAAGGEAALRGKLQDYVMLNEGGSTEAAPMSLDQLKEQVTGRQLPGAFLHLAGKGIAGLCLDAPSKHTPPPLTAFTPLDPSHPHQIQDKMRRKKTEQAAAERQARKAASRDQTDAMVEALRGGQRGKQGRQGKRKQQAAGGGKGFGGK